MSDYTLTPRDEQRDDWPLPVEVLLDPSETRGYAAVVKLCGEHDLATSADLHDALCRLYGNVLVDLSECRFIDSTALTVLIVDHRTRAAEGHRLELLVPTENRTISRTLDIAGLQDVLKVHARHPTRRDA